MTAQDHDHRRALRLEYLTVGWNAGEAVLTITLGLLAGSLALVGFGCDSLIEIFASVVVIWHLRPGAKHNPLRDRRALRLLAAAFLTLALVLSAAAIRDLTMQRRPDSSVAGIIYLGITAIVMFGLAAAKNRLAQNCGSVALRAEATMTFLDGILSLATLSGLALNAAFGLWWADAGAALVVAVAAANEARLTWKESNSPGD